ncbi:hypothetical protein K469DRAFT_267183 [Zopfia rhizophila CBS 207.26]|uniref:Uncharacterized protein n=1 Tax=Zopfia rhizophila CBS 207.26 TaxID=1314779 RepID=A0A6A6DN21_9PEZI|nr:hypothetical protein K469DRAFT_267183 [Zopfia rhizophila CBS 207.26]
MSGSFIATRDTDSLSFVVSIGALYWDQGRSSDAQDVPFARGFVSIVVTCGFTRGSRLSSKGACCRAQRMQQGMVKNPDTVIHESRRRGTSKALFMRRFHHGQALKQVRQTS